MQMKVSFTREGEISRVHYGRQDIRVMRGGSSNFNGEINNVYGLEQWKIKQVDGYITLVTIAKAAINEIDI